MIPAGCDVEGHVENFPFLTIEANAQCQAACDFCVPARAPPDDDDEEDDTPKPPDDGDDASYYDDASYDDDDAPKQKDDDAYYYSADAPVPEASEDDFYMDDDDGAVAELECGPDVVDSEHEGNPREGGWGHSCAWVHYHLPESCQRGADGAKARRYCPATCCQAQAAGGGGGGGVADATVPTGEVVNLNTTTTWWGRAEEAARDGGSSVILGAFVVGALCSALSLGGVILVQKYRAPDQQYQSVTRDADSGSIDGKIEMRPTSLARSGSSFESQSSLGVVSGDSGSALC